MTSPEVIFTISRRIRALPYHILKSLLTQILRREKHRITRHYNAKLQTTKKTLTTSKHSIEFTYSDFPCHFKVTRDKLALTNRRWMRKKGKRLTITVNFQEQNSGSEEQIRPVGRIVKSWTGHVRMISQSNLRI